MIFCCHGGGFSFIDFLTGDGGGGISESMIFLYQFTGLIAVTLYWGFGLKCKDQCYIYLYLFTSVCHYTAGD